MNPIGLPPARHDGVEAADDDVKVAVKVLVLVLDGAVVRHRLRAGDPLVDAPGGNCIKIGFPGKLILGDYFRENRTCTSRRPFLLVRISFPKRPIFIQFIPGGDLGLEAAHVVRPEEELPVEVAHVDGVLGGNSIDFKSFKKNNPKNCPNGIL